MQQGVSNRSNCKRKGDASQPPPIRPRLSKSNAPSSFIPNLLMLPDEALSHIFSILINSKEYSFTNRSSSAFSLASSHTRLFRVFATCVTHVTTEENFFHPEYIFLYRPKFLRPVLEKGDGTLRSLHLDTLHCGLFKDISKFCPGLEVFSVASPHDCDACCDTLGHFLTIRLRSLILTVTSDRILSAITTPPPDITLHIPYIFPIDMRHITGLTFNKVTLEFSFSRLMKKEAESLILNLFLQLEELCSRTTTLSVSVSYFILSSRPRDVFTLHQARRRFNSVSTNNEKLPCRSIKLSGECLFRLLRNVNPHASIELTSGDATFAHETGVIYAKKLPLYSEYLNSDVSRIQEVVIGRKCDRRWANVLSARHIPRAQVSNPQLASNLNLHADKVFIEVYHIQGTNWTCLSHASEVHILKPCPLAHLELRTLLEGLPHMLDGYNGFLCRAHGLAEHKYVVYISNNSDDEDDDDDSEDEDDYDYYGHIPRPNQSRSYRKSSYALTEDFMDSFERRRRIGNDIVEELALGLKASFGALQRFEERGGDGHSVRAMLGNIRRFMFTELGKEVQIVESR